MGSLVIISLQKFIGIGIIGIGIIGIGIDIRGYRI